MKLSGVFASNRILGLAAMVTLLIAICGLVAGCGGGSSSTSSGANEESSNEGGGESTESSASAGIDEQAIKSKLKPFLDAPKTISVTEPLNERPEGKVLEFLECSATPCKIIGSEFKESSEALGMQFKAIQAGSTPESFQAAAQQALEDEPDAVAMASLDQSLVKKQMAAMNAAGIVTSDMATENPPRATTLAFQDPTAYSNVGAAGARYIILESGGQANVMYVNQSLYSFGNAQGQGLKEALESECPECSFTEIDTSPEEVGTKIPSKVVSELQANPSINWVYFSYGAMNLGVSGALKAAGLEEQVKVVSQLATENNYENLKNGSEKMVIDTNDRELIYYEMDSIARALAGQKAANLESANFSYIIEGKDVTFDPNSERWEPNPNFAAEFEKLWEGK